MAASTCCSRTPPWSAASPGYAVLRNWPPRRALPSHLEFPFDPPQWGLERRDFVLERPFDVDGWVVLDETPGLGCVLNEELLARSRVA